MELFIDHKRGFILRLPWLRGGAEITPCHSNGLGESPTHQIVITPKEPPRKKFVGDYLVFAFTCDPDVPSRMCSPSQYWPAGPCWERRGRGRLQGCSASCCWSRSCTPPGASFPTGCFAPDFQVQVQVLFWGFKGFKPVVGLTLPLQSDGSPSPRLHTSQIMERRCRSWTCCWNLWKWKCGQLWN